MPELPEVETIAQRLSDKLVGRMIKSIEVLREKSWRGPAQPILNRPIRSISRTAKIISIDFTQNEHSLLIHLKMTGQLIHIGHDRQRTGGGHPTDDWINQLPSKHTRVVLLLDDESRLYFNDMRVFGWLKVVSPAQKQQAFKAYGLDIIDPKLTVTDFFQGLQRRKQAIKQVIMDGSFVAGVGNIYACDALFEAKISPTRSANSLSIKESQRLLSALRKMINLGIKLGGATIQNYKNVDGLAGGYQDVRKVYAREGEPCPRCGEPIKRIKQGGRSTFYCVQCQT